MELKKNGIEIFTSEKSVEATNKFLWSWPDSILWGKTNQRSDLVLANCLLGHCQLDENLFFK